MLPEVFLTRPLAHRGLHDARAGRIENSTSAFEAAIAARYGIELDVQLTGDGEAVVFHDYTLDRVTEQTGKVQDRSASELGNTPLKGSTDTVQTLKQTLEQVAGRTPVLVELKDQSGTFSQTEPLLERAVARAVEGYAGPVALMSFNPFMVEALAKLAPQTPRGLTTKSFARDKGLSHAARRDLREMSAFDRVGARFISHDTRTLGSAPVQRIKARGVPVLCWTVRSKRTEARARRVADNITFEGYLPPTEA